MLPIMVSKAFPPRMDRVKTSALSGAEIVVRCLQEEGVEYVFGYPGGAVLYIYDELFKQDKVKHVLVRHEQGAVHAADGYSRSTAEVGVALVTSGPGRDQRGDRHRHRVHGFDPDGGHHRPGADARRSARTRSRNATPSASRGRCVKHNFLVKDVRDLALTMKKAFHIARTGRPGPVVVDIPKDVSHARRAEFQLSEDGRDALVQPGAKGHAGQIQKAVQLLLEAKRPMIYTGGGVILGNASAELTRAGRPARLPVHQHADGPGRLSRRPTRKFLGMLGMHGTYEANMAMQNCDVLLADRRALRRPRDRQPEALRVRAERKIIHIDIDPSSISKRVKVDVPIVGDVEGRAATS